MLVFVTMLGMYADWADNYSQAAQAHLPAYVGPGFYLALAGMAGIIVAISLAWRRVA